MANTTDERLVEALLQDLLNQADGDAWRNAWDVASEGGLEPFDDLDDPDDPVKSVHTFEDEMVLTSNRGLVLKLNDGSEYQITIVQSRRPQ